MTARCSQCLLLAGALACAPATPQPLTQRSLPAPLAPPKVYARWELVPTHPWVVNGTLTVDGGTLEVGASGERWLKTSTDRVGASTLLESNIVGVARDSAGFWFLTDVGSVYFATEPLGVATMVSRTPTKPIMTQVGTASLLYVGAAGDLHRSTDHGKTWATVALPAPGNVVVGLSMHGDTGLLLGLPQRMLATKDDGATWHTVTSPAGAIHHLAQSTEGSFVVMTDGSRFAFDVQTMRFASVAIPAKPAVEWNETPEVTRVMDGGRLLALRRTEADNPEWSLSVGEMGHTAPAHVVDALAGCTGTSAAMRGDVVEIACDTHAANHYSVKLLRSEDAGKTFRDDGGFDTLGPAHANHDGIAIGSDGWVFIGSHCGPNVQSANVPRLLFGNDGWCDLGRARATASSPFVKATMHPIPFSEGQITDTTFARFATNAHQHDVYAIATDGRGGIYRFKPGSTEAELVAPFKSAGENHESATLTLEDDGTLHGFVEAWFATNPGGNNERRPFAFELKPGAKELTRIEVPPDTQRLAFGGSHITAWANGTFESDDGGKTWSRMGWPAGPSSLQACSASGCITRRGVRVGWGELQGLAPIVPPAPVTPANALACAARGAWSKLGYGAIPDVTETDLGKARWLHATREADGRVILHVNRRDDPPSKTTDVQLMAAEPKGPTWGADTEVYVQPGGVVVRRYSYLREHSPGVYNPVDATLAWYRVDDGKVLHATVPKLPPFKVRRYGLGYDESVVAYPNGELVSLDAKGVYFSGQSESPLYLLHDDGKVEKISSENPVFGVVVPVGQDTAVTAIASQHVVLTWLKKEVATWMVNDDASIFDFGGRAALAQTAAWLEPPRAWAVPIQRGPDPAEWFPLATQTSLGPVPRSCGARSGPYRYVAPPDKASPACGDPRRGRHAREAHDERSRHPKRADARWSVHGRAGRSTRRVDGSISCARFPGRPGPFGSLRVERQRHAGPGDGVHLGAMSAGVRINGTSLRDRRRLRAAARRRAVLHAGDGVGEHARSRRARPRHHALRRCEARGSHRRVRVARSVVHGVSHARARRGGRRHLRAQAGLAHGKARDGIAPDIAARLGGGGERDVLACADGAPLRRGDADEAHVRVAGGHGLSRSVARGADRRSGGLARPHRHRRFVVPDAREAGLARLVARQTRPGCSHPRRALGSRDACVSLSKRRGRAREIAPAVGFDLTARAHDGQRLTRPADGVLCDAAVCARALRACPTCHSISTRAGGWHTGRHGVVIEEARARFARIG